MSSVEADLCDWYQDAQFLDPGNWAVDHCALTADTFGGHLPPAEDESLHGFASNLADSQFLLPPQNPTSGGYLPYGEADPQVHQPPINFLCEYQHPEPVNLSASAVTAVVQDPSWGAGTTPYEPNPYMSSPATSIPQASVALHGSFEVTRPPQIPEPPRPPPPLPLPLDPPAAPIIDPGSAPSEWGAQQQHVLPRLPLLFKPKHPVWQALKQQRKRASRRLVDIRHRTKEREAQEKIKTESEMLQGLHDRLVAEEKALKGQRLDLMTELLAHAHCNDSAIDEYLQYAPKEIVRKARKHYLETARGQRAGSAPPAM
ncbi:uncharacterized protein THITE_2112843 [Thermothielavioides terrestris NRRL 8126]|uniref:BZIP domain-containing protein n=1 Tax=Thermothielavioides terrestris (strain ATCC 38088 / NRRL 8126) TaxID=578455 RepID=G2R0W5_THETT|nr:uncharacterized protein THITE_2112843 [Thermothielavioides terrestris NRRL 8126]AEO65659.1 hypothetical protein THITE_2112843 [Thermothielavioides terrestris NRRL 8126]